METLKEKKRVGPHSAKWASLSEEEKESYYRHNFTQRPEQIARKNQKGEDPILKAIRVWMPHGADEAAELAKVKQKMGIVD